MNVIDDEEDPQYNFGYWLGIAEALTGFRNHLTIDAHWDTGWSDDMGEVMVPLKDILASIEEYRESMDASNELARAKEVYNDLYFGPDEPTRSAIDSGEASMHEGSSDE